MINAVESLTAARQVESLLTAARDLLRDAEGVATDGRLGMIAKWIRDRIESLNGELLVEVRATVSALERQQANTSEPKS
jgi:hypothetical protein